jgi:hypothetical protein
MKHVFTSKYCYFFICSDRIWCINTPSEKLIEMMLQKNNNKKTMGAHGRRCRLFSHLRSWWFLAAWNSSNEAQNGKKWVKKIMTIALCMSICFFFFYSRFIEVNYVSSHIIMKENIWLNFYLEKKTYSSNYKLTNDEFDSRLCFSMAEVCNFKCCYLNLQ